MIVAKSGLELPVIDELLKITKYPSPDDAVRALTYGRVQAAAIEAAERIRTMVREEDDERQLKRRSLINYRRFYVGGVGIGVSITGSNKHPYKWWAFVAANTKPSKAASKFCAEMRIMTAAREVRCSCIGGLVVVGELQPDARSGKQRMTLDPCPECRDMMRCDRYRHLFRTRSQIMTAQPLAQVLNLETLPEMMAFHGEEF